MKPRHLLGALALSGAMAAAAPALAQLDPLTDPLPRTLGEPAERRIDRLEQTVRELRAILFQGRETGRPVVVQPAETSGQIEILNRRIIDLEATLQRVNGQLDVLAADIAAIRRDEQAAANTDRAQSQSLGQLTARLEAMDRELKALVEAERMRNEDPEVAFGRAMQMFVDGRIVPAAESFEQYLANHPDHDRAPEARYYLAESRFRQANYMDAARFYLAATRDWPQTPWAPDATVKLALALIEIRRPEEACGILDEFAVRYPEAPPQIKQQATSARARARCP